MSGGEATDDAAAGTATWGAGEECTAAAGRGGGKGAPALAAWARNADRSGPAAAGGATVVVVGEITPAPVGPTVVVTGMGTGTLAVAGADDDDRAVVAVPSAPGRKADTV